jgi:hypothetical protein
LRAAVANGERDVRPGLEPFRTLDSVAPISDRQYLQSLEQKVSDLQTALSELRESCAESAKRAAKARDEKQARVELGEQKIVDVQTAADADAARHEIARAELADSAWLPRETASSKTFIWSRRAHSPISRRPRE